MLKSSVNNTYLVSFRVMNSVCPNGTSWTVHSSTEYTERIADADRLLTHVCLNVGNSGCIWMIYLLTTTCFTINLPPNSLLLPGPFVCLTVEQLPRVKNLCPSSYSGVWVTDSTLTTIPWFSRWLNAFLGQMNIVGNKLAYTNPHVPTYKHTETEWETETQRPVHTRLRKRMILHVDKRTCPGNVRLSCKMSKAETKTYHQIGRNMGEGKTTCGKFSVA